MSEKFLKAAEEVKKLSLRQTKDAQYELYGLYKQVTMVIARQENQVL